MDKKFVEESLKTILNRASCYEIDNSTVINNLGEGFHSEILQISGGLYRVYTFDVNYDLCIYYEYLGNFHEEFEKAKIEIMNDLMDFLYVLKSHNDIDFFKNALDDINNIIKKLTTKMSDISNLKYSKKSLNEIESDETMTKTEFFNLLDKWEEIPCETRVALMDWFNVSYEEWNVYEDNPFDFLFPDDCLCVKDLTDEQFKVFLEQWRKESEIPDPDTFRDLVNLVVENKFTHFECAHCEELILHGDPDNWDDFQGVSQDEYHGQLCANCYSTYKTLAHYA